MVDLIQRQTVSHWLAAVADSCCSVWQSRVRVNRLCAVLIFYFKLVVEENRIFSESRAYGVVNIRKQTAFYGFARHGVEPFGLRLFADYCIEKSVNVGAVLAATWVAQIGEQINALFSAYHT